MNLKQEFCSIKEESKNMNILDSEIIENQKEEHFEYVVKHIKSKIKWDTNKIDLDLTNFLKMVGSKEPKPGYMKSLLIYYHILKRFNEEGVDYENISIYEKGRLQKPRLIIKI